jgi:hypothetical protein
LSSEVLLTVRDLRIAFSGVEAVRGLSFTARASRTPATVGTPRTPCTQGRKATRRKPTRLAKKDTPVVV